jgi:hypothetical protein
LKHALVSIEPLRLDIDPMLPVERVGGHGGTLARVAMAEEGIYHRSHRVAPVQLGWIGAEQD